MSSCFYKCESISANFPTGKLKQPQYRRTLFYTYLKCDLSKKGLNVNSVGERKDQPQKLKVSSRLQISVYLEGTRYVFYVL